jgi:DNA polymerase-3 subunit alpha
MNYTVFHLHSDCSVLDSTTKADDYIKKAKELNMSAIGFSEHGNVFNWIHKKQKCDELGIKYIHGQEFYLTESIEEKVRDNYHIILIARNWDGVKELNRLSSRAYHNDGHYYYNARITLDELINTSDNLLISTACLASPLSKGFEKPVFDKYLEFLAHNKHRCFLELQPHNVEDQKKYNLLLYSLHQKYEIPLIAGTDTHSLQQEHLVTRKILLKAKNMNYADEDSFDLSFHTYDKLVEMFKFQDCLPEKVWMQAIENTNYMASLVEEFQLDTSNKYPRLLESPERVFKSKITEGLKYRNIEEKSNKEDYFKRIKEEYEVYKKCDAIDYMLFQEDIIDYAISIGANPGPGRGSVNGSIIAYLLKITDMDSIKFDLNFFRFINPDRISLADYKFIISIIFCAITYTKRRILTSYKTK